jgi:hypothetical protein
MRSRKNHKPTVAWKAVFVTLAIQRGVVGIRDSKAKHRFEKQKQTLAAKLREAFRIDGDPLPWNARQQAYVARFVIRDDRPLDEREPDRHRRR